MIHFTEKVKNYPVISQVTIWYYLLEISIYYRRAVIQLVIGGSLMLKWSAYKVCTCNSWKQMYFEMVTATEVRCIYSFFSYNKETR